jgi:hypothetical protein
MPLGIGVKSITERNATLLGLDESFVRALKQRG